MVKVHLGQNLEQRVLDIEIAMRSPVLSSALKFSGAYASLVVVHELVHGVAGIALGGDIRSIDLDFIGSNIKVAVAGLDYLGQGIASAAPEIVMGSVSMGVLNANNRQALHGDQEAALRMVTAGVFFPPVYGFFELISGGYGDMSIALVNTALALTEEFPALRPLAERIDFPATTFIGTAVTTLCAYGLYKFGKKAYDACLSLVKNS